MKDFNDFIAYVNNSNEVQDLLIRKTSLNLDDKSYNLADEKDFANVVHAIQSGTLQGCMELLRVYHEWLNH